MNTRSKTKELVERGLLCIKCLDTICDYAYATWCQSNSNMCLKCVGQKCYFCRRSMVIESKIYVLDGLPECIPLCKQCFDDEKK